MGIGNYSKDIKQKVQDLLEKVTSSDVYTSVKLTRKISKILTPSNREYQE